LRRPRSLVRCANLLLAFATAFATLERCAMAPTSPESRLAEAAALAMAERDWIS
jgi:hypothetical protein